MGLKGATGDLLASSAKRAAREAAHAVQSAISKQMKNIGKITSKAVRRQVTASIKTSLKNIKNQTAELIAKRSSNRITKEAAGEALEKAGKESADKFARESSEKLTREMAEKGIKNTSKRGAKAAFTSFMAAAGLATVLGYGTYRAIDSFNEYNDKVDQVYRVMSIKAVSVVDPILQVMPWNAVRNCIRKTLPKSKMVLIKYSPATALAKGDAIQLNAVSEEAEEEGRRPTPSGTNIDNHIWSVVSIATPGEALIDLKEHNIANLSQEISKGNGISDQPTMKVHSSWEGTYAQNVGGDLNSGVRKVAGVAGDAMGGVFQAITGMPLDGDQIADLIILMVILFIIIKVVGIIGSFRSAFGRRGGVEESHQPHQLPQHQL